jgi:hypothetical protein
MKRTVSKLSVESSQDIKSMTPACSHGNALRFSRVDKKTGSVRDFYACSANRDRKLCNIFHWVDDWERKLRSGAVIEQPVKALPEPRAKLMRNDNELGIPALTDDSANSQFLFSSDSLAFITRAISTYLNDVKSKRFMCIGTPSIHKALLDLSIESVLLDEDERLEEIFPQAQRFNMFNGESYGKPLPTDDFCGIAVDPPFQPELLGALFATLKRLFPMSLNGLVLLAFPYFNEKQVVHAFAESISMSDIRLCYRNHKKHTSAIRSPVRLYSSKNMYSLAGEEPGYRYCERCKDLKYESNQHCQNCDACTTIAGTESFVHCDKCGVCVKPHASHCNKCNRCFIGTHTH